MGCRRFLSSVDASGAVVGLLEVVLAVDVALVFVVSAADEVVAFHIKRASVPCPACHSSEIRAHQLCLASVVDPQRPEVAHNAKVLGIEALARHNLRRLLVDRDIISLVALEAFRGGDGDEEEDGGDDGSLGVQHLVIFCREAFPALRAIRLFSRGR